MFSIEKKFTFEAAHFLNLEKDHPCSVIHGHSYKLYIKISTEHLNQNGFIIDFGILKNIVKGIIDRFDHALILTERQFTDLNNNLIKICPNQKILVLPGWFTNTSAELMCNYISDQVAYDIFREIGEFKCELEFKLYETENNSASYKIIIKKDNREDYES